MKLVRILANLEAPDIYVRDFMVILALKRFTEIYMESSCLMAKQKANIMGDILRTTCQNHSA